MSEITANSILGNTTYPKQRALNKFLQHSRDLKEGRKQVFSITVIPKQDKGLNKKNCYAKKAAALEKAIVLSLNAKLKKYTESRTKIKFAS